ncbi:hypothetical protein [Cellulomonas iranensis]|uniref:hypothetical protein n=1 Tax=Cellulomonas iranensis TaxID=76862 RepID=UPI0013D7B814|nr:hypothetical protein [Cellulomonas iranensis]
MRVVSQDLDDEVAGTSVADRLEVHAWRGGALVAQGLAVTAWSLGWDASRAVQGQATVTVADPDGDLAPWGMGDALAPGGSRLQITWVSGLSGIRVPLGWWRIRAADPAEQWRVYRGGDGSHVARVPSGGHVSLAADEETATIEMDRLDAQVVTAPTSLGEVRRLLADLVPVVVHPSVVDGPVPAGLVYGDSRLSAVIGHLTDRGAVYRMGPAGELEVLPAGGVGPVWTLAGGDDGVLVGVARSLSDDGVYNAAVSTSTAPDGAPLVGRAQLTSGPLAWGVGTAFGRVPIFHQAIATTQSGVDADARTVLASRVAAGEVDLAVTCLTHPGLQLHDRVVVLAPTRAGDAAIEGRVVAMTMRSATSEAGTTPAKAMALTVRVSVEALEAIAARVRRG